MTDIEMRARAIFFEALDRETPEEIGDYIEKACGDDVPLRDRVDNLQRAHADAGEFLGGSVPDVATLDAPITERPGTVIGHYKLLEQIGEGGFGVVFMAEQSEPVKRKVALKILKAGMDTKQVVARFEAERQALAIMDHPNIAHVHDAGATESGRPYFVMELVKGLRITEYCDANKLDTRQRLQLFLQVCHAVQHAHQKGIIHRDIKPSNVLVTPHDGVPVVKVIDFGIAKAMSGQLTDKTVFTGFAQMIGTPLYMSPEQAELNALDVDTRSDIYSLGVLMYELLTGTTPFDEATLKKAGFDEIRRIIREVDPPRPSARISTIGKMGTTLSERRKSDPRKLSRVLRGELDWVVMKALEKDRTRRYETANSFAKDIERYLNDEPVQACSPSVVYRFRKYVRKHRGRLSMAAASLLFLLLIGGSFGWALWDQQARRARTTAQIETIIETVDRLCQLKRWTEALAAAKRAKTAIEAGTADAQTKARVQQLLADLQLVQQLEQARMLRSEFQAGDWDYFNADQAYAKAFLGANLDIDRLTVNEVLARFQTRKSIQIEVATALADWARTRKNRNRKGDGEAKNWEHLLAVADALDPDRWRTQLRDIWKQGGQHRVDELRKLADSAEIEKLSPTAVLRLATLLQADVQFEDAVQLLRKAQHRYPGDFWINCALAVNLNKLKQPAEATEFYRAALAIRPGNAFVLNNLGAVLDAQERLDEAIVCWRDAIEIDRNYAYAHNNLAVGYYKKGELDKAIFYYKKVIQIGPKDIKARDAIAHVYWKKGEIYRDKKEWDQAILCYLEAAKYDEDHYNAHFHAGLAYRQLKEFKKALDCYKKAINIDPTCADAYINSGVVYEEKNDLEKAKDWWEQAIEKDPEHPAAHHNLGKYYLKKRQWDKAIDHYKQAVKYYPAWAKAKGEVSQPLNSNKNATPFTEKYAESYCNLGVAYGQMGQLDQAIDSLQKAIQIDSTNARVLHNLGATYYRKGDLQNAIDSYGKAIEFDDENADTHNNLGLAYYAKGELDSAVESFGQAVDIDPKHTLARGNLGRTERVLAVLKRMANPGPGQQVFEGELTAKDPLDRVLDQSHHKFHTVTLNAGKIYHIELISYEFDTYLRLEDSQKRKCGENDDVSRFDLNSRLYFMPPQKELYRVIVTSYEGGRTGRYFLEVQEWVPSGQPVLHKGDLSEQSPLLDRANGKHYYSPHHFKMHAGKSYLFDFESTDFDPTLLVKDEKGQVIAGNDDRGPEDLNSRVFLSTDSDCTVELVLTTAQPKMSGDYSLRIQRYSPPDKGHKTKTKRLEKEN